MRIESRSQFRPLVFFLAITALALLGAGELAAKGRPDVTGSENQTDNAAQEDSSSSTTLDGNEVIHLVFMREEEKLARDVYVSSVRHYLGAYLAELERVGASRDLSWVYAEAPVPDDLTALTLVHDALRDLWPDQVNLVNIDRDGKTLSALFAGAGREVEIQLHPVPE